MAIRRLRRKQVMPQSKGELRAYKTTPGVSSGYLVYLDSVEAFDRERQAAMAAMAADKR